MIVKVVGEGQRYRGYNHDTGALVETNESGDRPPDVGLQRVDGCSPFGIGYDTPLAMTSAGSSTYFEQDSLSSVTSLSDQSGAVVGRYGYDTYGQITAHTGTPSPYTYTGREYDAGSGLYDYRARWYDPAVGRFLSEDPEQTLNLYTYAESSPIDAMDPSGKTTLAEEDASQSVSSAISQPTYNLYRSAGLRRVDAALKLYRRTVYASRTSTRLVFRQMVQLIKKLTGFSVIPAARCAGHMLDLWDPDCDPLQPDSAY